MSLLGPLLLLVGLALCWVIGRFANRLHSLLTGSATAVFGIGALVTSFPDVWNDNFVVALLVLVVYGAIGSMVFRAGRATRERAR